MTAQTSAPQVELLPCPLCQSIGDNLSLGVCYVNHPRVKEGAVLCKVCGCRATLKAWNTRPSPDSEGVEAKLLLFLQILESAGGETSGNDARWNWINYFCNDAEPLDTFNQASKRKLTRVTHDSDSDDSMVYITQAGRDYAIRPQASAGDRAAFTEILKHVRAPRRESSERLDRIEKICVEVLSATLEPGRGK